MCAVFYCSNNEIVDSNTTRDVNICEYVKMCFMSVCPVACANQAANVRIKHTEKDQTKMYGEVEENFSDTEFNKDKQKCTKNRQPQHRTYGCIQT